MRAARVRAPGSHHEVTAAGGSSIIEFAGAAPRRPKPAPTPHGTRVCFAAIHQLISSFRVRAGDPAGARITSISGTLATRRRRVSPLRLRQALAGPQKGPAALPDLMAAAGPQSSNAAVLINTSNVASEKDISCSAGKERFGRCPALPKADTSRHRIQQ